MFDPFLGFVLLVMRPAVGWGDVLVGLCSYLDVFVELVCDVLSWDPAAEVLVLHLLDPLNGVFGD